MITSDKLKQYYSEIKSIIDLSVGQLSVGNELLQGWLGAEENFNAVHIAAIFQDKAMIERLHRADVDFNSTDGNANNALHSLHRFNQCPNPDFAKLLVYYGVKSDAKNYFGKLPNEIVCEFDINTPSNTVVKTLRTKAEKTPALIDTDKNGNSYNLLN